MSHKTNKNKNQSYQPSNSISNMDDCNDYSNSVANDDYCKAKKQSNKNKKRNSTTDCR